MLDNPKDPSELIAVVGRSIRFPGAATIEDFWRNIANQASAVEDLTTAELEAVGVSALEYRAGDYVRKSSSFGRHDMFDAGFFSMSPKEAEIVDPQQRLLLELCQHVLDDGSLWENLDTKLTGIFVGVGYNSYLGQNLLTNPELVETLGLQALLVGNGASFAASRLAYKFGFTGPCMTVDTACSTGLTVIHLAAQSLLNFETDIALAGSASLMVQDGRGYRYTPGGIFSPDGDCLPFCEGSNGTLFASGGGMIALRRLSDAIEDGDPVLAVIQGSAINSDGSQRVGYTAPSIDGQTRVILEALADAQIEADEIGMVECHGTGTAIGDPIEIRALTEAFEQTSTDLPRGKCAIGSVKSNLGHLDAAAGVAGFIKAVEAVQRTALPPSRVVGQPSATLNLQDTPFFLNDEVRAWPATDSGRRFAGVSAFGLGGSNAHLILGEAPQDLCVSRDGLHVIPVSAHTETALETACSELATSLMASPDIDLSSLSKSLLSGRRAFDKRIAFAAETVEQAIEKLGKISAKNAARTAVSSPKIAFVFPGQGAQYPGMLWDLIENDPIVKADIADLAARVSAIDPQLDLLEILHPSGQAWPTPNDTLFSQLGLFCVGIAYVRLLASHGIEPDILMGNSIGEIAAAHVAGLFDLTDALRLVVGRGKIMRSAPKGAMLTVQGDRQTLEQAIRDDCWISGFSAAGVFTVAGTETAIADLQDTLEGDARLICRRLETAHPFHTPLMEEAAEGFAAVLKTIRFREPTLPIVSNLTGLIADPALMSTARYWLNHLSQPVHLDKGWETLRDQNVDMIVEAGPQGGTRSFVRQLTGDAMRVVSLGRPKSAKASSCRDSYYQALAQLWCGGVTLEAERLGLGNVARLSSLPGYPFERKRHWIEPPKTQDNTAGPVFDTFRSDIIEETVAPVEADVERGSLFIVAEEGQDATQAIVEAFDDLGWKTRLLTSEALVAAAENHSGAMFILDLRPMLLADPDSSVANARVSMFRTFSELANLSNPFRLAVATPRALSVPSKPARSPQMAFVSGLVHSANIEWSGQARVAMIDGSPDWLDAPAVLADVVTREADAGLSREVVMWNDSDRFIYDYRSMEISSESSRLRDGGCFLLVGGLGAIGREIARYLVTEVQAEVIIATREQSPFQDGQQLFVDGLNAAGGRASLLSFDPSKRDGIVKLRDDAERISGRAIDGLFHCAGDMTFAPLSEISTDQLDHEFSPKVELLEHILAAFEGAVPGFLAICSSTASLAGGLGQASYAAANAAMDAIAEGARQAGWPIVLFNFDVWRDIGMARKVDVPDTYRPLVKERLSRGLPTEFAIERIFHAINSGKFGRFIIAHRDWHAGIRQLAELPVSESPRLPRGVDPVAIADPKQLVQSIWLDVLGVGEIDAQSNFFELGGDSLLLLQVQKALANSGIVLSAADLFRAPTLASLTSLISSNTTSAARTKPARDSLNGDVAIIGYAGRFPGADTCGALGSMVRKGESGFQNSGTDQAKPEHRPEFASMSEFDLFDADFFSVSRDEATLTDPQQRVFLELCHEALEGASVVPHDHEPVGVYASTAISRYLLTQLLPLLNGKSSHSADALQIAIGNDTNFLASRVAYRLGLTGPAVAVSTACSSSLVAVHMAREALLRGECDFAIAGGVRIDVNAAEGYEFEQGSILSKSGICRPFDDQADGTIFGNGAGVVVLQRLDQALAEHREIHAVIKGSAINNDGSTKAGFTAPMPAGQAAVIRACLDQAEIDPSTIGYVETHGTGTRLGDPIEVAALAEVWSTATGETDCVLGSVKANIGHLDAAAGVTGLISAIEHIKHRTLPPLANFSKLNSEIDLAGAGLKVLESAEEWPEVDGTRRAGISSFGIGGTNAHVLIEQPPALVQGVSADRVLLLASAKTTRALASFLNSLGDHAAGAEPADINNMAFTLARGRVHHTLRRALVVDVGSATRELKNASAEHVERAPLHGAVLFGDLDLELVQGLADMWCGVSPAFGKAWKRHCQSIDDMPNAADRLTMALSVELALAEVIASLGLDEGPMCGVGLGECAAVVAAGILSADDLLGMALADPPHSVSADPKKAYFSGTAGRSLQGRAALDQIAKVLASKRQMGAIQPVASGDGWPEIAVSVGTCNQKSSDPQFTLPVIGAASDVQSAYLEIIGRMWETRSDLNLDLDSLLPRDGKFIALPPYPYSRKRYWYAHRDSGHAVDPPLHSPVDRFPRFFEPTWRRCEAPVASEALPSTWVIFEEGGLGAALAEYARTVGHHALIVGRTSGSKVDHVIADPGDQGAISGLIADILSRDRPITMFAGWAISGGLAGAKDQLNSFYAIARELNSVAPAQSWAWIQASDRLFRLPGQPTSIPEQAVLMGIPLSFAFESTDARLRLVDLDLTGMRVEEAVDILSLEAESSDLSEAVAWRAGCRYQRSFDASPVPSASRSRQVNLGDGDVVVVTGGGGGLGRHMAARLASRARIKLVVLGRRALPEADEWEKVAGEDGVDSASLQNLIEMQSLGLDPTYLQVDLSDRKRLAKALDDVEAEWGSIKGVIHLAGVAGGGLAVAREAQDVEAVLTPKVDGTLALLEALRSRNPEFILLFSSLIGTVGMPGQIDYAGANAFMDALSESVAPELPVTSIAWDMWEDVGMASGSKLAALLKQLPADAPSRTMTVEQGLSLFDQFLDGVRPPVLAACSEPPQVLRDSLRQILAIASDDLAGHSGDGAPPIDILSSRSRADIEKNIADAWQAVLMVDGVSADADFFELGGDSLTAARLASQLRRDLGIEISMETFFDDPTVSGIATAIITQVDDSDALEAKNRSLEGADA